MSGGGELIFFWWISVSIVVETADAMTFAPAKALMEGLAAVGSATGIEPHFFHVCTSR